MLSSAGINEPKLEKKSSRSKGGGGTGKAAPSTVSSGNAAKLKIVVRRLPPLMTEEEFREHTAQWLDEANIESFYYWKGKVPKDIRAKVSRLSRAYIKFKSQEYILALREGLDGRILTDNKGNQSRPQVEFAPFQKVPKKNVKHDARQGTIDQDPEYIAFLELLKTGAPLQAASTHSSVNATANGNDVSVAGGVQQAADKPTSTPLIEYIRAQKAAGASSSQAEKASKKEKDGMSKREKRLAERKGKGKGSSEKDKEREKDKTGNIEKVVKIAVRAANTENAAVASRRAKSVPETPSTSAPPKPASVSSENPPKLSTPQSPSTPTSSAAPASSKPPRRERGSAAFAAAILQRDLGLGGPLGPLRRKDRKIACGSNAGANAGGGGQQSSPNADATEGATEEPRNRKPETAIQGQQEKVPEQSSQQKASRRSRRNRGGQGNTSTTSNEPPAHPKAPIAILKKQNSTTGVSGVSSIPAPLQPQILKREAPTTPSTPTTASPTPATPSTNVSSLVTNMSPAHQVNAPPQSPGGPKGGRSGRPPHRGNRGTNAGPAKAPNTGSVGETTFPKSLTQPANTAQGNNSLKPITPSSPQGPAVKQPVANTENSPVAS
ncbi:Smg-4/UPF3 family-domain-containing protein, partial [Kalaharituber pfeilii]